MGLLRTTLIAIYEACSIIRSSGASERGQLLIMVAGSMTLIMAAAAIAIDTGFASHTRRDLQNDVDAMVLAAVRELPDEEAAEDVADDYATNNNVAGSEVQSFDTGETCDGNSLNGTVTAELQRDQETFLARVLGINVVTLNVCATARIGLAEAGNGLLPFGLLEQDPEVDDVCYFDRSGDDDDDPEFWENSCLLKIPKPNETWASGNTGPIRLDEGGPEGNYAGDCSPGDSGASEYRENIEEGGECFYAVDDLIRTKTGNMTGPTCTAMENRLGDNDDSLEAVFGPENSEGIHYAPNRLHPRFGIVPIVLVPEGATGSSTEVTITGFIAVYLEDACHTGSCNGNGNNPACVLVKPVKTYIVMSGAGFADGDITDVKNALRTIKLVN